MANKKMEIPALNPETVRVLRAQGLTFPQVAQCLGISEDTLARRRKEDPELEQACLEGKSQGIMQVTNALFKQALAGNVACMIFYLKNQAGWKDKHDLPPEGDKPYVIMGAEPAESVDEWVNQHKPQLPQPTEH